MNGAEGDSLLECEIDRVSNHNLCSHQQVIKVPKRITKICRMEGFDRRKRNPIHHVSRRVSVHSDIALSQVPASTTSVSLRTRITSSVALTGGSCPDWNAHQTTTAATHSTNNARITSGHFWHLSVPCDVRTWVEECTPDELPRLCWCSGLGMPWLFVVSSWWRWMHWWCGNSRKRGVWRWVSSYLTGWDSAWAVGHWQSGWSQMKWLGAFVWAAVRNGGENGTPMPYCVGVAIRWGRVRGEASRSDKENSWRLSWRTLSPTLPQHPPLSQIPYRMSIIRGEWNQPISLKRGGASGGWDGLKAGAMFGAKRAIVASDRGFSNHWNPR